MVWGIWKPKRERERWGKVKKVERHGPLRQNNSSLTLLYTPKSKHPALTKHTHTHNHTRKHSSLSKRKCSRCGRGIMLDMWSRSCSMLVIPILRGFELSSRLDLYSVSLSVSNLLHLSLSVCLSPSLSWNCGGMDFWNKARNELTVGEKREAGGLHLKRAWQCFSNIYPLLLSLSSVLLTRMTA